MLTNKLTALEEKKTERKLLILYYYYILFIKIYIFLAGAKDETLPAGTGTYNNQSSTERSCGSPKLPDETTRLMRRVLQLVKEQSLAPFPLALPQIVKYGSAQHPFTISPHLSKVTSSYSFFST